MVRVRKEKYIQRLDLSWVLGNSSVRNSTRGQRPGEDFFKCSMLVWSPEAIEPTPRLIMAEEVSSIARGRPQVQSLPTMESLSYKEQPQRKG